LHFDINWRKVDLLPLSVKICSVTICLENLEMSGNLKHVREMSGKKSCHGKVSQNCSLLVEYLRSTPFFFCSQTYTPILVNFAVPVSRFCLPLLFKLH